MVTVQKVRVVFGFLLYTGILWGTNRAKAQLPQTLNTGTVVGSVSVNRKSWIAQYHAFKYAQIELIDPNTGDVYDSLLKSKRWRKENSHRYGKVVYSYNKDFKEGKKRVLLFKLDLPAGDYAFSQIEVFLNSGQMQSTHRFGIVVPFRVAPAKTKYLGELAFNWKEREFEVLDRIEMDRGALQNKFGEDVVIDEN